MSIGPDQQSISTMTTTQTISAVSGAPQSATHLGTSGMSIPIASGQDQGISSGVGSGGGGKRNSSNSNAANLANLPPIERPKVKASRKIPGKESLSPSSKDSNILGPTNTSPGGGGLPVATSSGISQQQQTSVCTVGSAVPVPPSVGPQQQAKKSQLQAALHQHSQQLAQLQQLQQLNQQLQQQVISENIRAVIRKNGHWQYCE